MYALHTDGEKVCLPICECKQLPSAIFNRILCVLNQFRNGSVSNRDAPLERECKQSIGWSISWCLNCWICMCVLIQAAIYLNRMQTHSILGFVSIDFRLDDKVTEIGKRKKNQQFLPFTHTRQSNQILIWTIELRANWLMVSFSTSKLNWRTWNISKGTLDARRHSDGVLNAASIDSLNHTKLPK